MPLATGVCVCRQIPINFHQIAIDSQLIPGKTKAWQGVAHRRRVVLSGDDGPQVFDHRRMHTPKDTIQFPKQPDGDLEQSTKTRGVNSRAEVVRKAPSVARYLLREQKGGGTLVVENKREKTKKELIPI